MLDLFLWEFVMWFMSTPFILYITCFNFLNGSVYFSIVNIQCVEKHIFTHFHITWICRNKIISRKMSFEVFRTNPSVRHWHWVHRSSKYCTLCFERSLFLIQIKISIFATAREFFKTFCRYISSCCWNIQFPTVSLYFSFSLLPCHGLSFFLNILSLDLPTSPEINRSKIKLIFVNVIPALIFRDRSLMRTALVTYYKRVNNAQLCVIS